jgi:hypothetical protein
MQKEGISNYLIIVLMVVLSLFYIIYWPGKLMQGRAGFVFDLYLQMRKHIGLLTFLALLGVVSLFVDVIVRWDTFTFRGKRARVIVTAFICMAFVLQLLTTVMDLYLTGQTS